MYIRPEQKAPIHKAYDYDDSNDNDDDDDVVVVVGFRPRFIKPQALFKCRTKTYRYL